MKFLNEFNRLRLIICNFNSAAVDSSALCITHLSHRLMLPVKAIASIV